MLKFDSVGEGRMVDVYMGVTREQDSLCEGCFNHTTKDWRAMGYAIGKRTCAECGRVHGEDIVPKVTSVLDMDKVINDAIIGMDDDSGYW